MSEDEPNKVADDPGKHEEHQGRREVEGLYSDPNDVDHMSRVREIDEILPSTERNDCRPERMNNDCSNRNCHSCPRWFEVHVRGIRS